MPKVSIIVPVYNVENYIAECLNSLINQTLKDIEIICVDDCGQDNSMKIVEDFAKKDKRIKIFKHEENKGLGEARNTGIKNATSEYIGFLDSDDFVDLDYYEEMYHLITKSNTNIIYNQNIIEYYDNKDSLKQFDKWNSKKTGLIKISNDNLSYLFSTPWCKMFKTSFIKNNELKFPFKLKHEDEYFNMVSLSINKEIYIFNGKPYYYRQRDNSIMKQEAFKNFDMIVILKMLFDNFKERNLLSTYKIPVSRLIWISQNHKYKEEFKEKTKEFIQKMYPDIKNYLHLYTKEENDFINDILNMKKAKNFEIKIKIFNFIPILKIKKTNNKIVIKLLNFIPLIKIKSK